MEIKPDYIEDLLKKTETALASIEVLKPEGEKIKDMASRYISDSRHFLEQGELVSSLGAVEYAHGLLDAGIGAGVLKVSGNSDLFVFADEQIE